ncbi:hypothetical protein [Methylobacterium sp. AMS5]|uniref:hypothetical protein n=1 Tax=Methylobacterium sp. AMS5 TaxID=925818 RepID=UPI00074F9700|nr:hypothetical protein [Methylobacterium sp. AMS5]AMB46903.1 hypothetical protein Y590_18360 [Methylobacterium sp. AMS5]
MNLTAIRPRKAAVQEQAERSIADRNRGVGHGNLLFRDTAPVISAVVKGLQAAPAAAPSPGGLAASIKAAFAPVIASVEKTTASIKAATVAPKAVAPGPAQRSIGTSSVPMTTEAVRRREADAREQARKAAARDDADRVLVTKSGPRVLTFRKLDPTLSDAAIRALSHIVSEWEKAERRPVRIYAADLHRALDIPLTTAQAAFTELVDKRLLISSKNSAGVQQVLPGLGVTGV